MGRYWRHIRTRNLLARRSFHVSISRMGRSHECTILRNYHVRRNLEAHAIVFAESRNILGRAIPRATYNIMGNRGRNDVAHRPCWFDGLEPIHVLQRKTLFGRPTFLPRTFHPRNPGDSDHTLRHRSKQQGSQTQDTRRVCCAHHTRSGCATRDTSTSIPGL